jgi:hypothetical protein
MSWGIEISKIDLSHKKLCERCIKLWTMCGYTLLKLPNFLHKYYGQKYATTTICIFWSNLDIIIIIMCY